MHLQLVELVKIATRILPLWRNVAHYLNCRAGGFCLVLACTSGAYATTLQYHRWQFGEFAATLRYLRYGVPTPGINDIYAKEIKNFRKVEEVEIGFLCPTETQGTLSGQWTFFGARLLPLPTARQLPSFYSVSYLGGAVGFHNGTSFDALIEPNDIRESLSAKKCVSQFGLADKHTKTFGYAHLNREGHHAPLSYNSLDIDGDLLGDFTFGGVLYTSKTKFSAIGATNAGGEAIFIRTANGVRLTRLHQNLLSKDHFQDNKLHTEAALPLQTVAVNAGHSLVVFPGRRNDEDWIGVRLECGLAAFDPNSAKISQVLCISGLTGNWALPGARADFDGDGIEDFWLSQTSLGNPMSPSISSVRLISGALWRKASGTVPIDQLTIATITGSSRYSDYDGIATTLSPFAGDLDGDKKPDLTFSGHRHMNEAGALYVLFGRDLRRNINITLDSPLISKIAGNLMSQLAPPFHHWDASDWDNDGCDDIVVSADNDLYSGLNAGAIHVLSGKKIVNAVGLSTQCK